MTRNNLPDQNPEKRITITPEGELDTNFDPSTVTADEIIGVPLIMPSGITLLIPDLAGAVLDTNGKPIDHSKDGVIMRLDGATLARLGGKAIVIPAEQPK